MERRGGEIVRRGEHAGPQDQIGTGEAAAELGDEVLRADPRRSRVGRGGRATRVEGRKGVGGADRDGGRHEQHPRSHSREIWEWRHPLAAALDERSARGEEERHVRAELFRDPRALVRWELERPGLERRVERGGSVAAPAGEAGRNRDVLVESRRERTDRGASPVRLRGRSTGRGDGAQHEVVGGW